MGKDFLEKDLLEKAYDEWYRSYPYPEADKQVLPYLQWPEPLKMGWLRMIRKSLFLSTTTVARRMGISVSAYSRMERIEAEGNITIQKLRELADAMDCELIYAIRPKKKVVFSRIVWSQIAKTIEKHKNFRTENTSSGNPRYLAFLARWAVEKSMVRRKHGWNLRKGYSGYRDGVED